MRLVFSPLSFSDKSGPVEINLWRQVSCSVEEGNIPDERTRARLVRAFCWRKVSKMHFGSPAPPSRGNLQRLVAR